MQCLIKTFEGEFLHTESWLNLSFLGGHLIVSFSLPDEKNLSSCHVKIILSFFGAPHQFRAWTKIHLSNAVKNCNLLWNQGATVPRCVRKSFQMRKLSLPNFGLMKYYFRMQFFSNWIDAKNFSKHFITPTRPEISKKRLSQISLLNTSADLCSKMWPKLGEHTIKTKLV